MARSLNRLKALNVPSLKVGRHSDGGNLYLIVGKDGSRRWTFMFSLGDRQREAGFGAAAKVSLAEARRKAAEWRSLLAHGVDPIEAKKGASEARKAVPLKPSFGECVDELIKTKGPAWRSEKYRRQWRKTLVEDAGSIWDLPVDEVATEHVLGVLKPLWARLPDAASRLRGRMEATLDFAAANKWREPGPNPAQWRGNLAHLFPKRPAHQRGHHKALPYSELPAFVAKLREEDTTKARALELVILTATRISEVLGARWSEVDIEAAVWTVPGDRMKAAVEHRIPLAPRALEILAEMSAVRTNDYIFPGRRSRRPISRRPVYELAQAAGVTAHGFRSTIRDWAGEETHFSREVAEAALAHAVGNAVERAYRRGDALEKRRELMAAWALYCGAEA
jgi:integrase